jgi:phospholipase/lecithinase/hemolysin
MRAPSAASVSVANADLGLNALIGAGARNILFLGGDVSRLPEVAGTPIAPIGGAFSLSYNQGMKAALAGYAARGVTVTYVDLERIREKVSANPEAFGLIGAGACPATCLTNPALADRYLFHVDRLHLSAAGFAIVGRYAVEQLRAGRSG